ncbi:hypothetical protein MAR_007901 [Mya arenaria]|uniref:Uncharacterized protein n=1 Tax=Mya arenaria TaxID=6604 RepID=A0ABY7DXG9_MYAAR|nr:hypothetical protein MAR_007901 [Mya arenaria]
MSYLGEFGSSANICASACISACFDSAERISKGIQGIYDTIDDFIERNNLFRDADEIAVPSLFINSIDDPFHPKMNIPYELCNWAELVLDYLDSVSDFTNKGNRIDYGKRTARSTI